METRGEQNKAQKKILRQCRERRETQSLTWQYACKEVWRWSGEGDRFQYIASNKNEWSLFFTKVKINNFAKL